VYGVAGKLCDPMFTRVIRERLRNEQLIITRYMNETYITFTFTVIVFLIGLSNVSRYEGISACVRL